MVEELEWMRPVDLRILEFFSTNDIIINPSSLSRNIEYDRSYVADRCQLLASHDLLIKSEGPAYRLSDKGRAYLDGELDASELGTVD